MTEKHKHQWEPMIYYKFCCCGKSSLIGENKMKYKEEEQYPDVYCKRKHSHTKDCMQ